MITRADIDMAKKAVLAATIDIVDGNHGGFDLLAKIFAEHRIAQIERDAVIADDHKLNTEATDDPGVWAYTTAATDIGVAIRDQAASPSQNGGVG